VQQVWFSWRPDAAPEAIEAAMAELRLLGSIIPEIVSLSCGKNVTARTPHTHGLLVVLRDFDGAQHLRRSEAGRQCGSCGAQMRALRQAIRLDPTRSDAVRFAVRLSHIVAGHGIRSFDTLV